MEGWVKFHRKIEEWGWYTDPNTFRVFFHLVLKANHKPNSWRGIEIGKGQLITSRDKLAEQLNLSVQQVRTSLKKLESTQEITIKATNKYTLVTIENYTIYQTKDEKATSKSTNEQPSNNHQVTTNKNVKNVKNKDYSDLFVSLYDKYPYRKSKRDTFNSYKKLLKEYSHEDLERAVDNYIIEIKDKNITMPYSSNNFFGTKAYFEDYLKAKVVIKPNYSVTDLSGVKIEYADESTT